MLLRRHREIAAAARGHEDRWLSAMRAARGDESQVRPELLRLHAEWTALRGASWARLDRPERLAWAAHGQVDGQVVRRETLYRGAKDKEGEQMAVLEGGFVATVLREWCGAETDEMPRAWAGVLMLHDFRWQKGREHGSVCWHAENPLALVAPERRPDGWLRCHHCKARTTCRVCWTDGEWHSHSGHVDG